MRTKSLLIASVFAFAATPALAGHVPAGPAGGPAAVGSTIVPNAKRPVAAPRLPARLREVMGRWIPGQAGFVVLPQEQARAMANTLRAAQGSVTEGTVIAAPTTLAGNAPGTIILDTQSNRFGIVREALLASDGGIASDAGPQAVPQEPPATPQSSALTADEATAPAVKR